MLSSYKLASLCSPYLLLVHRTARPYSDGKYKVHTVALENSACRIILCL